MRFLPLIPLLARDAGDPDYIILEEALAKSSVEISEVTEGGRIPELKMINKSADKILVVDGEELVGAKKKRVVNASFLIGPHAEVIIAVSCVEQGRWAYRSQKFQSHLCPGLP